MNESQHPAHPYPPQRRRRRRRLNPRFLVVIAVAALVLIGLLVWLASLLAGGEAEPEITTTAPTVLSQPTEPSLTEPEPTLPEGSEQTVPTETEPTQPSTEPTLPPEPTPMELLEQFAAEHGLTLADYPEKLIELLGRNEETLEFVMNYPLKYGTEQPIDISGYADTEGVPLFIQWDQQWGYRDYVGNVAGLSGCGPTCMAMVMYHFTRDPNMHPAYMMEFAESNRTYASVGGATQWAFFKNGGAELGLTVEELNYDEIHSERTLARILESGKVIVMNVGPGVFTEIGHYMVLAGYEDGKFRVNDPNSPANSAQLWDFEIFEDQIKMMWAFSM